MTLRHHPRQRSTEHYAEDQPFSAPPDRTQFPDLFHPTPRHAESKGSKRATLDASQLAQMAAAMEQPETLGGQGSGLDYSRGTSNRLGGAREHGMSFPSKERGQESETDEVPPNLMSLGRPSRGRYDSYSSIGSSVAPARGGVYGGGAYGGAGPSTRQAVERETLSPPLEAQHGAGGAFMSFAPPGRVQRHGNGSEAGSVAGASAISGWSAGVLSGSGRRRRAEERHRMPMPTFEEQNAGMASVARWRETSAVAPASSGASDRGNESTLRSRSGRERTGSSSISPELPRSDMSKSSLASMLTDRTYKRRERSESRSRRGAPSMPLTIPGLSRSGARTDLPGEVGRAHQEASPLRRWVRWMAKVGLKDWTMLVGITGVAWLKWTSGLGGYSGKLGLHALSPRLETRIELSLTCFRPRYCTNVWRFRSTTALDGDHATFTRARMVLLRPSILGP